MNRIFENIKQEIQSYESTLKPNRDIGMLFPDYKFGEVMRVSHIWNTETDFIHFKEVVGISNYQIMLPLDNKIGFALCPRKTENANNSGNRIIFESPY